MPRRGGCDRKATGGQEAARAPPHVAITTNRHGATLPATDFTTATIDANGLWTVAATAPLAPGTYTLTPVATLVGGKTIAGDAVSVTIAGQPSQNTRRALSVVLQSGQSFLNQQSRPAMSQASLDHVKQLYDALLGRDPSAADQANFAAYLDAGGNGAAAVANSPEAAAQVGAIYDQVLGRAASTGEIANGQAYLAGGGTLAGLRTSAANSFESGSAVNALYVNSLGRNASYADFQGTERFLAGGGTLSQLGTMIGNSAEAKSVTSALYQNVLGRSASAADLAAVQAALGSGSTSVAALYTDLVASTENGANLAATYQQAAGIAPPSGTVATMEAAQRSSGSSILTTIAAQGPALAIPNPTPPAPAFTSGGAITSLISAAPTIGPATAAPPIAEITGVSLGTHEWPSMTFFTASGNVTLTGDLLATPTGPETVSVAATLLGVTLPASAFAPAAADASGHFALTSARDLPNGTYALSLTTTAPDGTTTAGHAATLVIAAPNAG